MNPSDQLQIQFESKPRARKTDPVTSHAAAMKAVRFAVGHKARILAALKTHGPRTAHELSQIIGLTVVQIDRRLCEMKPAVQVSKLDDGADLVRGGFRVWSVIE